MYVCVCLCVYVRMYVCLVSTILLVITMSQARTTIGRRLISAAKYLTSRDPCSPHSPFSKILQHHLNTSWFLCKICVSLIRAPLHLFVRTWTVAHGARHSSHRLNWPWKLTPGQRTSPLWGSNTPWMLTQPQKVESLRLGGSFRVCHGCVGEQWSLGNLHLLHGSREKNAP